MSEYNIQMNKYNALNTEYDQLYPQPMKHANTHAKDGSDPITSADIGAYSKIETDSLLSSKPNPNLLDNWYFANCVDQRQGRVVKPNTTYYSDNTLTTSAGTTSAYVPAYRYATGTASGVNYASFKLEDTDTAPTYYAAPENVVRGYVGARYGIDRWKGYDSGQVVLIYNDHISIKHGVTNGVIEFFDKDYFAILSNKTMTLSYLLMNNVLLVHTFTTGNTKWWYPKEIDGYRIEFGHTENPYVDIASANDIDVKAAKLELGSQQTLAHQDKNGNWVLNEIPDFGEQLARCQRYFQLYSTADNRPSKAVDCRPTMRTDPSQGTIIIDGTTYYYNTADL